MKIVIKVIKIALFVYFLYTLGIFSALSASSSVADKSFSITKNVSAHDALAARSAELYKKVDGKEVGEIGLKVFYTYLLNLPSALILFLIWLYQDKKRIRKPLSLILLLVIYPFVIAKLIYKWIQVKDSSISFLDKKYVLEAELRRTKESFFSALTEDETLIIHEALKKNISRKEFRTSLTKRGLKVKRSFVFALTVTMFLVLLPKDLLSSANDFISTDRVEICSLTSHSVDNDVGTQMPDAILDSFIFEMFMIAEYVSIFAVPTTAQPFYEIDYIPW